ncbi:MAG: F0F1 ATP synthase subunit B [Clostridia bacterium]|nr:F0F1 ATP synthase subunit B [Clostridia bacterium]
MLQSLDVISVNLWHMLISLANLVLLFLILKRFLFRPVQSAFAKRQADLEHRYAAADSAREQALQSRAQWEHTLAQAEEQAGQILERATRQASRQADALLADAREQAVSITQRARDAAEQEKRRAESEIRQEIVEASTALAAGLLEREMTPDDHRAMIEGFLKDLEDVPHEKQ